MSNAAASTFPGASPRLSSRPRSRGLRRSAAPTARAMAETLHHRGPDDSGDWADAEAGVALGHRRLSIIDLSPAGHQPMLS